MPVFTLNNIATSRQSDWELCFRHICDIQLKNQDSRNSNSVYDYKGGNERIINVDKHISVVYCWNMRLKTLLIHARKQWGMEIKSHARNPLHTRRSPPASSTRQLVWLLASAVYEQVLSHNAFLLK